MMTAPVPPAAWTLGRLLDGLAPCRAHADLPIDGLCSDSRRCAPGDSGQRQTAARRSRSAATAV